MYTFIPEDAACVSPDGEYCYRFEDDVLVYSVNGGETFRHQLWDYSVDTILVKSRARVVKTKHFSLKEKTVTHYQTFGIRVASCRYIIGFIPDYILSAAAAKLVKLAPTSISRLNISGDGVTFLHSRNNPNMVSMSMAGAGYYRSVQVNRELIESVRWRMLNMDNKYKNSLLADSARYLQSNGLNHDDANLAALVIATHYSISQVRPLPTAIDNFAMPGDTDGPAPGRQVAAPIVTYPALSAKRCPSNEVATIEERIENVRNEVVPDDKYTRYAAEFVARVIPSPAGGWPVNLTEVMDAQVRPTQRARNQRAGPYHETPTNAIVRSFQKAEAYGKPKPPRNISTLPINHTLALSRFTLGMKPAITRWPFVHVGKDPATISAAVVALAGRGIQIVGRDFSTFDGTISEFLYRHIARAACLRWAHPDVKNEFARLLDAETRAPATTQLGLHYRPGYGRLSGSPTTSDHNTLINAFVSYATFREAGFSPTKAFSSLGVYLGDDSLDAFSPKLQSVCARVCQDLGLRAKFVVHKRGEWILYLARYFNPTTGASFADPMRAIGKLHISFSGEADPVQALANRAHGYMNTDSQTPIISDWCRAVLRLTSGYVPEIEGVGQQMAWPQDPSVLEGFPVVTGISANELSAFQRQCESAQDLESLPTRVVHNEEYPRIAAYINGELYPGPINSSELISPSDESNNNGTTTTTTATIEMWPNQAECGGR